MSALLYPLPAGRLGLPDGVVSLAVRNPLLRGLIAIDCGSAVTKKAPPGQLTAASDAAKSAATRFGVVRRGIAGKHWPGVDLSVTNECTFFLIDRFSAAKSATECAGVGKAGRSNGSTCLAAYGGTSKSYRWRAGGATSNYYYELIISESELFSFSRRALTVTSSGAATSYIDGKAVNSGTISGALVARTDLDLFTAGGFYGGDPLPVELDIALAMVWNRALSAREIELLSANPRQIFATRKRRRAIGAAAGGADLAGQASGGAVASGSAGLSASIGLAGVGVAVAGGAASLGAAVPMSAIGIAVASGSAGPVATVSISASGLAQAAGSAGLSASVLLAGAGAAVASGNAALAAQLAALAAGGAVASGSASLSGGALGSISASGAALAGGAAALVVSVKLAAAGSASASGSATLSGGPAGAMSASGSATAGGSAALTAAVSLSAAGFVAAMGAGALSIVAPLSANGQAIAGGAAVLGLGGDVITLDPDPMLDALYESGAFGLADDCLLGAAAFTAFLDTADADYFAAQSTSHTLRYRLGVPLKAGDPVTVNGTLYRVSGAPRQINTGELRAALVRVPS